MLEKSTSMHGRESDSKRNEIDDAITIWSLILGQNTSIQVCRPSHLGIINRN